MVLQKGEEMLTMKRVGGLNSGNGVDNKTLCGNESLPGFPGCSPGN